MKVKYIFSSRRTRKIDPHNKHRKEYPSLAKQVILSSDIVLEILDARFIQDTRNEELEEFAKKKNKRLAFVINKTDLTNVKELKESLILTDLKPYVLTSCKKRDGAKQLQTFIRTQANKKTEENYAGNNDQTDFKPLKKYKHAKGYENFLKTPNKVHVGIIGFPNVGKSSILNLLTGKETAKVSPKSGFTRGIQKIKFSEDIILLDTPGVFTGQDASPDQTARLKKHAMIGARSYESVKNPELIISEIMKKKPGLLEKHYNTTSNEDSETLIENLGRKWGYLKQKNEVNTDRTARRILADWQKGKIKG